MQHGWLVENDLMQVINNHVHALIGPLKRVNFKTLIAQLGKNRARVDLHTAHNNNNRVDIVHGEAFLQCAKKVCAT